VKCKNGVITGLLFCYARNTDFTARNLYKSLTFVQQYSLLISCSKSNQRKQYYYKVKGFKVITIKTGLTRREEYFFSYGSG